MVTVLKGVVECNKQSSLNLAHSILLYTISVGCSAQMINESHDYVRPSLAVLEDSSVCESLLFPCYWTLLYPGHSNTSDPYNNTVSDRHSTKSTAALSDP
jgi:hypothetical protein